MSNGWGRARAARPAELRNGMCAIGRGHHPSGVSPRCPRRGPLSGGTGTPPPAHAGGNADFTMTHFVGFDKWALHCRRETSQSLVHSDRASVIQSSRSCHCPMDLRDSLSDLTDLLLSIAGEIQGPGRSPRWRGAISVCRDRRVPGRGQLWEAVGTSAAAGCCMVLGRGCRGERQPLGAAVAVTDHRPAGLAFLPRFRGTECRIRMPRTSRPREGTEVLGRRGPPSFHAMAPGRRLTGCYGI